MTRNFTTFTRSRRLLGFVAAGILAVGGLAISAPASAQSGDATTICTAVLADPNAGADGRTLLVCVAVTDQTVAVDRVNFDEQLLIGLDAPIEGGAVDATRVTGDQNAAIERRNFDAPVMNGANTAIENRNLEAVGATPDLNAAIERGNLDAVGGATDLNAAIERGNLDAIPGSTNLGPTIDRE